MSKFTAYCWMLNKTFTTESHEDLRYAVVIRYRDVDGSLKTDIEWSPLSFRDATQNLLEKIGVSSLNDKSIKISALCDVEKEGEKVVDSGDQDW